MNKKILIASVFATFMLFVPMTSVVGVISKNATTDNQPPNPPSITVPDKITVGKWFKIKAVITDPDGDNVYIRFNASILPDLPAFWWGPIPSGITYTGLVKYRDPLGTYTIGVQAKDVHDAESEWTYVQFNVTKNKTINIPFLNFLQSHPYLFPFLRLLLQR
jgi:hypothetical protein